jgi:uncharacterized membrane protein YkvA (DUF1232 family)
MIRNAFFSAALKKAASIAGKPGRVLLLVSKLAAKLRDVNWNNVNSKELKSKFYVLGRMVKAYAAGDYRNVSWKSVLLIIAAILYFVNPVDLLPDLIPVLGLTDDFGILLWVYNTVAGEVDKFLLWERSQIRPSTAE